MNLSYAISTHVRDLVIFTDVLAALLLAYLAFATTSGAGFYCRMALLLSVDRTAKCLFSLTMAYDALQYVQEESGAVPIDTDVGIRVFILIGLVIAALRIRYAVKPNRALYSWSRPMRMPH